MVLSLGTPYTLVLLPWGSIFCCGIALATMCEPGLISSLLVIIKIPFKAIINMQHVSLIVCMGDSRNKVSLFIPLLI